MNYKNIFITGSTGVVGKPLLKKLLENGHNVYALARSKNQFLESENVTIIEGDLFSKDLLSKLEDKEIDAVFHVAGVNKMCAKNPQKMFDVNIQGTERMLELGNKLNIKKFVYTSSAVTLGEGNNQIGNEKATHRGHFLSKYEESKFLAEKAAFKFDKNFDFVSVNPSSVQGPGRVSGTAKLLISTLRKKFPPLIKNNISVVDIDDCTKGHYNALLYGKDSERYVLNSFQTSTPDLIKKLKDISDWKGTPLYAPKLLLKFFAPLGDLVKLLSSSSPLLCRESVRVLTHGHIYDGSKASKELNLNYTNLDSFITKTINWLIDENRIQLNKI